MAQASAFTTLIERGVGKIGSRTLVSNGVVLATENNLADWFVRLELSNTGISKTNNGSLTLRIDGAGTFIRSGPILIDEATKNNYMIELQIKQDLDNDGIFGAGVYNPTTNPTGEESITLRAIIGRPQIRIDQTFGEVLTVQLMGMEFGMKEVFDAEWHLFKTPDDSFLRRLQVMEQNAGSTVFVDNFTNNLPTAPDLTYKPDQPVSVHSSLANIIDQLSNPDVEGGAFDDFYFDVDPSTTDTRFLSMTAEKFGLQDSGVVIDPLSVVVADTEEENTIVTDNLEYKNHVIMIGTADGGSLPTERTRFASAFEHARFRAEWVSGTSYEVGDLVQFITDPPRKPSLTTYHKCLVANSGTNDPMTGNGEWLIDFSTTAKYVTVSSAFYKQGEIVTLVSGLNTHFFQANQSGLLGTPVPLSSTVDWLDFAQIPNTLYTEFISYTPWTNDVDTWKQTLASNARGEAITGSDVSYDGWAFDWNVTKANYNRRNLTNHYEPVSGKSVVAIQKTPPTGRDRYDGVRYIVDKAPTGDWAGTAPDGSLKNDRIAEYDDNPSDTGSGEWIYSDLPVDSDVVTVLDGLDTPATNDLGGAELKKYVGTHPSGTWQTLWSPEQEGTTDKPSPFHICRNVGLVAGATGISGQAVEFAYDWYVNPLDPLPNKSYLNRTSRGLWISSSFPLPRKDTNQFNTAELYGGTGGVGTVMGTFDTNNLDRDRTGKVGWNRGLQTEDMGKISAFVCKMRGSMFQDRTGTDLVEGVPDIPMIFWTADKFDRVWFYKFKLRRNGQWDRVKIPIGDLARTQLHFGRYDELTKLNGVVMTEWDFTLQEKEFSGVQFDWRQMKYWGFQTEESYTGVGLYKNGHQRAWDFAEDIFADISANLHWYATGLFGAVIRRLLPKHTPVTQNHKRFFGKIAIDDWHFEKEQIATSNDALLIDSRMIVESAPQERDYLNVKKRAIARQARKRFFPQIWHIRSTGDIRLRFGHALKIIGTRVPFQPTNPLYPTYNAGTTYALGDFAVLGGFVYQSKKSGNIGNAVTDKDFWENMNEVVASEIKHIYDHDGYHCEIAGFRKFVVSG